MYSTDPNGLGPFGGPGPMDPNYDPFSEAWNRVMSRRRLDGVLDQRINYGPDAGLHRGYDPATGEQFQSGYDRFGK